MHLLWIVKDLFYVTYIYIFLLGGIKNACSELHIDDNERRRLTDLLLNGSARFFSSVHCEFSGISYINDTVH